MPQKSGPFTPVDEIPITVSNPAAGSGNLVSSTAVIINLSPFELLISSAESAVEAMVDPLTRDAVSLGATGQQLVITPISVGFTLPAGIVPSIFVLWYLPAETPPGALPAPIVAYGDLQMVSIASQPIEVGGNITVGSVTDPVTVGAITNDVAVTGPAGGSVTVAGTVDVGSITSGTVDISGGTIDVGAINSTTAVSAAQSLLATEALSVTSVTVTLPPNCESISVVIPYATYVPAVVSVQGNTTGLSYPGSMSIAVTGGGRQSITNVSVSTALDDKLTITIVSGAPNNTWYVVANSFIASALPATPPALSNFSTNITTGGTIFTSGEGGTLIFTMMYENNGATKDQLRANGGYLFAVEASTSHNFPIPPQGFFLPDAATLSLDSGPGGASSPFGIMFQQL